MEENLMEKLLNDFNGTLNEFNELVKNNDFDGVKRVLDEVNRLLQERNGIVLDDREPQYDHVLHELLDKMEGIVEKETTVQGIGGVVGSRYYTNQQIEEMIAEAEQQLEEITRMVATYEGVDDAAYAQARHDRSAIIERISDLRAYLVEGQEFSTLTYIDPHLAELQEERARLVEEKKRLIEEKNANLEEIERLRAEENPEVPGTPVNQARLDEINARISELEDLFSDIEGQINNIRETNITQLIANLRTQTAEIPELEARRAELQERLRAAGERVNETRGFDEQYAQARAEYSGLVEEIAEVENEINVINQNENDIAFLESLLPEVEERENVLEPNDYTYMGSLSDEQIIRRLLSEQLGLSEEEINETIGEYELVQEGAGAHDEYGEDTPISMRQLVRTRTVKGDITVGEALDSLETQLYNETVADYTQDISEIDARITELDEIITTSEARIGEIESQTVSDIIAQRQENNNRRAELEARRAELQERLRAAGERVNETRGFDEQYAQARAEYSGLVEEIAEVENEINIINQNENDIAFLESLLPEVEERENVTVGEALENLEQEISDLQARRAELQERLRAAGERVNETRGFDEQYAQARADYSALVQEIADIDAQIAELRGRQDGLKNIVGIKNENERIASAKEEKEALLARKNELEQDSSRQENPQVRERINRLKEISGISALEAQLQQYKDEYEKLQKEKETLVGTPGKPGIDNSEKIAALEARNKEIDARIAEIDTRIAEIDEEISRISGIVPPKKETEKLDVAEEAHKIGDHIFKTAAIRRELAQRNVTRDEFLTFYQAGLDRTNEQIDQLAEEYQKYIEEVKIVLSDPEDPTKRIDTQIKDAEKDGNTELATKLYEQMRKNFIAAGREEQLKDMGLDHEITSPEDAQKMKNFFFAYKESVKDGSSSIRTSIEELKENATIFSKEIIRIKSEKATLEIAGESIEELESRVEERKKMRRMLLEASITPEDDLTDEQKELLESWQNASERFLSKKTTATYIYIDKDGVEKAIDVDTIDDTYPEYAKDIEFLGVPAYKENLEQVSAWNQTNDPYIFGIDAGRAFEAAEAEREGAGQELINRIIADKQKYVETFNGIPNPHKVKYENWKTAGSTLKGMKPVSRDLPMQSRAKNAVENVFRFLGIRAPKFTRLDEHGNEVRDLKGGLGTLATDALVIGAVAGSAIAFGPAVAVVGYAAKGIVTAGNRIAARVEYSKHKDEIDSNKPVLNQADSDAREVARKEYYREQGDNRFISWVKAKSDKYFTRKREKETEAAIVEKLVSEYSEIEDKRTETLKMNLEIAEANQKARLKRQAQIAMGANTYNDIVRDPDAIHMGAATAAIARNAALESNKPGSGKEDVNKGSTAERKEQYVKQEEPVARTLNLSEVEKEATIPVSAVTAEQIYTGRKQYVDRLNKVLTIVTAAGLNFAHTAWKNGFVKEDVIHHPEVTKDDVIHHDAEYADVPVTDYETQFDTSKTIDELRQNYAGRTTDTYITVSGGLRGETARNLANEEITAAWIDDGSAWGTGISDARGLTATEFVDRYADLGLLDANGALRPDVTVQEMLDAVGTQNVDLTTLDGVYMSVGDRYWVSASDLMDGMTRDVAVGSHIETQLIKDAWDETVTTVVTPAWDETVKTFSSDLVVKAIKDGAVTGAAIGVVDELHEAMQTTYIDGTTPGRPEEVTPEATDTFDVIANKLFAQAEKEKIEREEAEAEAMEEEYYEEEEPEEER